METCIRKPLIFISEEEVKEKRKNLEIVSTREISLQPELYETRSLHRQYEEKLRGVLEETDTDLVQASRRFITGKNHTAIFYRDLELRKRVEVYSGRIPC